MFVFMVLSYSAFPLSCLLFHPFCIVCRFGTSSRLSKTITLNPYKCALGAFSVPHRAQVGSRHALRWRVSAQTLRFFGGKVGLKGSFLEISEIENGTQIRFFNKYRHRDLLKMVPWSGLEQKHWKTMKTRSENEGFRSGKHAKV